MLDFMQLDGQRLRPITRAEYDRFIELGVFDHDKDLQLLHGMLVRMSPQSDEHFSVIVALNELLVLAFHGRAVVQPQGPLAIGDDSEPEPDLALVKRGGKSKLPLLVVEVSASSLQLDRGVKASLYAQARIPEYWIVNLPDRCVEVHRLPKRGRYTKTSIRSPGQAVSVEALPGPTFAVADFLPKR